MPTATDQPQPPAWTRSAHRLDRPKIDAWYKPEDHGPLDGFLVWQGQEEHRLSGETYHAFAIREAESGRMIGLAERAALRFLRQVRPGSRVYIRPVGKKDLGDGRSMWEFEAYAQDIEHDTAGERLPRKPAANGKAAADEDGAGAAGDRIPF